MSTGRISLLVDSPLQKLALAWGKFPAEDRKLANAATKREAESLFKEEIAQHGLSRLQHKVLVDSARVGVTDRNVFLRSGAVGKLRDGTPVSALATAVEFGRPSVAPVSSKSKKGTPYKRRTGSLFGPRNRKGNTFFPATRASIKRIASLRIQVALRVFHDLAESVK